MLSKLKYETIQQIRQMKQHSTNEEIAVTLGISRATVGNYSKGIIRELHCLYCGKSFKSSQGLGVHLKPCKLARELQDKFCDSCQNLILWHVTSMGAKIYRCRLRLKPQIENGKPICRERF